ncbi:MAG: DNA mismatch repair protein, partial [Verrucomicrobiota bacterium]
GHGSLFQWINAATTPMGRSALKTMLIEPSKEIDLIRKRQDAIRELGREVDWRQRLEMEGSRKANRFTEPEKLIEWAETEPLFTPGAAAMVFYRILPFLTIGCLFFPSVTVRMIGGLLLFVHLAVLNLTGRKTNEVVERVAKNDEGLKTLGRLALVIEEGRPEAELLKETQTRLTSAPGLTASASIRKIARIAGWMNVRHNKEVHTSLNFVFFWDVLFSVAAEKWRRKHGAHLRTWLETIGAFEAWSSLGTIHFEHPDWAFPVWSDDASSFSAETLGHPLIPDDTRICNDVDLSRDGGIVIITGSNMTGKSTLLRAVGLNMVLAECGAPVCASALSAFPFRVVTSMRAVDSLEMGRSTFYAELLRIKMIIEAAKEKEPVLFLIDELFRGTNSRDQRDGTFAVLRSLDEQHAIGMVATHDVTIGRLEEEEPGQFKNVHFQERLEGIDLIFDYKIQPGISTTTNAIHLMKRLGIWPEKS